MTYPDTWRNASPKRPDLLPLRPYTEWCEACGRRGLQRSGGLWCRWCRRWLNDMRGWKL